MSPSPAPPSDVSSVGSPARSQTVRSIEHLPGHVRFWGVATGALVLDLWSKAWAFRALGPDAPEPFIPGIVDFHRSLNDGAVFGSFTGQVGLFIVASLVALGFVLYLFVRTPPRSWVTQIALGLVLAGALGNLYDRAVVKADIVRYRLPTGGEATRIGTIVEESEDTIVVGDWPDGARAQTLRRSEVDIRRQGVVRDFIHFTMRFPRWVPGVGGRDVWPWIFNVADAALVVGVIVLIFSSWSSHRPREAS